MSYQIAPSGTSSSLNIQNYPLIIQKFSFLSSSRLDLRLSRSGSGCRGGGETTVNSVRVTIAGTADRLAATGSVHVGPVGVVDGRCVDGNSEVGEQTVLEGVTQVDVVQEGVGVGVLGLHGDHAVVCVGCDGDRVGIVRVGGLDLADHVLVPEDLTNVGDGATRQGVVGQQSSAPVHNVVVVGGAVSVVTGEQGVEGHHTVLIGLLYTTEEGAVVVGQVVGVTVAISHQAGVDTGGVAAPDLGVDASEGLAGLDVNELLLDGDRNTLLVLTDVAADVLAGDPVGSGFTLSAGSEEADLLVVVEDLGLGGAGRDGTGGQVRFVQHLSGVATGLQLTAVHIDHGAATGLGAGVKATGLQAGLTLLQTVGHTALEGALLKGLTLLMVTRVGGGQQGIADDGQVKDVLDLHIESGRRVAEMLDNVRMLAMRVGD